MRFISMTRKGAARRSGLCAALLLMTAAFPSGAQVIVTDIANTAASESTLAGQIAEHSQTAARWLTRLEQWNTTWAHYQQKIAAMQSLLSGAGFDFPASLLDKPLTPVSLSLGVEQKCHPASSGLSVSSIVSAITDQIGPSNEMDIVGQQRMLCSKMVVMQNMKYNEAVALINDTMPKMTDQYVKIMTNVKTIFGDTEGNQQQKANDIAAVDSYTNAKFAAFEQRIKQYDAYIASLEARQRTLAQMAFKGDKGLVGTLVQTTALAAALKVNE